MNKTKQAVPLGELTIPMFGQWAIYEGGPYTAKPRSMRGIKMAEEIDAPCAWDVPTKDFCTPPPGPLYDAMVQSIAYALDTGMIVYVGCLAGKGRTGLFLATLAYLAGEDEPIEYVRENYYEHAVETEAQEHFVTNTFSRDQFRRDVMQALFDSEAIDWDWFKYLSWRDRWLYLKTFLKSVW